MQSYLRHFIARSLMAIALIATVFIGWIAWDVQPTHADVRQFQESADQVIYESRTKLYDSNNNVWRAIAFNRMNDDGDSSLRLRIVGYPNSDAVLHPHPLIISSVEANAIELDDVSDELFTDDPSVGNVGQYDLGSVISDIPEKVELVISLPTSDGDEIRLTLSPLDVQEWKALAEPA